MIKTVKSLTFTLVLLFVAVTAALCGSQLSVSSYQACRCKQSSPSTGNDNELCCSSLALGNSVYSTYTLTYCCSGKYGGYGTSDGDTRCCTSGYWVAAQTACWTLCSSVTCSGTTPDKNGQTYKETTGSCCQAATAKTPCTSSKKCLAGQTFNSAGYVEDGNCCVGTPTAACPSSPTKDVCGTTSGGNNIWVEKECACRCCSGGAKTTGLDANGYAKNCTNGLAPYTCDV